MASASSIPSSSSASAATKPPVAIAEDRTYPHPDNITSWSEDMRRWPSVTSPDVIYYLVNTKACDLQDVKAYRSLESYNYLQTPGKLPLGPLLMPMGEEELAALYRDSPFRDLFNIPGTLLYDTFNAPEREESAVAANDAATPCHGSHLATDDLPSSWEPCIRYYAEHVAVTSTAAAALEEATRTQQTPT
ncbi:hypothetical protein HPB47_018506 [Ixodes persulcatus]|uniref:Uncharacterized protein n=1 Tax=Ixodes persulcatus TaxID=34615 RepID=A0AC60QN46_IXOPE|nr:hypothetical protein HPB47_018506 [Ixodes persulcatus]